MIRSSIVAAAAVAVAALGVLPAHAQTAPTPSPTPLQGFSAKGTLVVQSQVQGTPMKLDAEVAVMSSKRRVRIDLLHLNMSGDPNAQGMIAQFLPQGTITLVYDQSSGTTTIWSEQKRVYYQRRTKPTPSPRAIPLPLPTPSSSPIDQFLHATRSITEYDVLSQSLNLVGHQPINGHTSTVLHFTVQSQKHGAKLQDVSGDLALADDLSGVPIRLWVTMKGDMDGSAKLDLLSASITPPDASVFAVPSGYRQVQHMLEVFGSSAGL